MENKGEGGFTHSTEASESFSTNGRHCSHGLGELVIVAEATPSLDNDIVVDEEVAEKEAGKEEEDRVGKTDLAKTAEKLSDGSGLVGKGAWENDELVVNCWRSWTIGSECELIVIAGDEVVDNVDTEGSMRLDETEEIVSEAVSWFRIMEVGRCHKTETSKNPEPTTSLKMGET